MAAGFASTETFRRSAFFLGPVLAAVLLGSGSGFTSGFQSVLALAAVSGGVGTLVQHVLYNASDDTVGEAFAGLEQIRRDLRELPAPLRPLLVADTLVRFANGMVYAFFVLVVTRVYEVGFAASVAVAGQTYSVAVSPAAFFGYLLGVEMLVALFTMVPAARLAERVGLKPVVACGFAVYALFPAVLIGVPELVGVSQWVFVGLFAVSGLRFARLPSHKALIVGPAEAGAGGRVTGSYYLLRNALVIPSAALGGVLWEFVSPQVAFGLASVVGVCGVGYFIVFGEEFEPYR